MVAGGTWARLGGARVMLRIARRDQQHVRREDARPLVASRLRFATGQSEVPGFPAFLGALSSGTTSFELVSNQGEIALVVVSSPVQHGGAGGLARAAWPGVVEPAEPVRFEAPFLGLELSCVLADWVPLVPRRPADFDFLATAVRRLVAAEDSRVCLQLLVRPVGDTGWRSWAAREAWQLTAPDAGLGSLIESLVFGSSAQDPPPPRWLRAVQEAALNKSGAATLFATNVRIGASGTNRASAQRVLDDLVDLARAAYSGGFNNFTMTPIPPQHHFGYLFNNRLIDGGFVATPDEIGSLWHPPSAVLTDVPGLWQPSSLVRSPREARIGDVHLGHDPAGHPVGLRSADWNATFFVGASGAGKSTLNVQLALAAAARREAVVWIEPKAAETVDAILERLDSDAAERVVVIDPVRDPLVAFNALWRPTGVRGSQVADGVVAAVVLVGPALGHRSERLLRMAVTAVADGLATPTMLDVHTFLVSPELRTRVLSELPDDDYAATFWRDEFGALSAGQRSQWVGPVLHRLSPFLADERVRRFVATSPGIDLDALTRAGAIITANFSGMLGQNAVVLANLLLSTISRMALSRAQQPPATRPRLNLFIDEAHMVNADLSRMLALTRAFNINLYVAGQFFHQLPDDVVESLLANATSMVAFRLGERDARLLGERFGPEFRTADLTALDNYHAAARLVVDGKIARPFTLVTEPLPKGRGMAWAETVRERSLQRHATPVIHQRTTHRKPASAGSPIVAVEWDVD